MKWIVLLMIFVAGCAAPAAIDTAPSRSQESPATAPQDDVAMPDDIFEEPESAEPPRQDPPQAIETAKESCDTEVNPLSITHITLSFDDEGLIKKDDGFEFRFYPRDRQGNIVPAEGNLQVYLYWTELFNEKRRSKEVVFGYNKFIRLSDVEPDCSPKPVFISFAEIAQDLKFPVEDDDPGFIKVVFKISQSSSEFDGSYMAPEGKSFFQ